MCERDGWKDVRDANGELICKVDPERAIIEVKPGRGKRIQRIDLTRFGLKPAHRPDKPDP